MSCKSICMAIAALVLTACASTPPPGPYWEDPAWVSRFKWSIVLVYPSPEVMPGLQPGTATVRVDYQDELPVNTVIVKSTGSPILDQTILDDIKRSSLPMATGPDRSQAHSLQFDMTISPTIVNLAAAIKQAIMDQTMETLRKQSPASGGYVLVEFYYLDGKMLEPKVLNPVPEMQALDDAVIAQMQTVILPGPVPPFIVGKKTKMVVAFCFDADHTACSDAQRRTETYH